MNILFLGTVAGQFLIMGLCDVPCRWLAARSGQGAGGRAVPVSLFSVLASASGIVGLYFVLVWREGVGLHYLFIRLYKGIFLPQL